MSLIHRQKRTQKETKQEAQPVAETPITEYQRELSDAAEKRERWDAVEAEEARARKALQDNAERVYTQQQLAKEARAKEQAAAEAIAEKLRLEQVAKNNAEAETQAKRERENYEFVQFHRNASPEDRDEMNRRYVEESVALAEHNRLETQAQYDAQQRAEAEQIEHARREFRQREAAHQATVRNLKEAEERTAEQQIRTNGNINCEVCGQPVRPGAPWHMSADFKARCVRDIDATLDAGLITAEAAEELRKARAVAVAVAK